MTIQEIHLSVKQLPPDERLKLAAMILNELAQTTERIDDRDAWSEPDMRDLAAFSLQYANTTLYTKEEEDELI